MLSMIAAIIQTKWDVIHKLRLQSNPFRHHFLRKTVVMKDINAKVVYVYGIHGFVIHRLIVKQVKSTIMSNSFLIYCNNL
jgi:hypothetical protein